MGKPPALPSLLQKDKFTIQTLQHTGGEGRGCKGKRRTSEVNQYLRGSSECLGVGQVIWQGFLNEINSAGFKGVQGKSRHTWSPLQEDSENFEFR